MPSSRGVPEFHLRETTPIQGEGKMPSLRTMGTPSRAGRADGDALRPEGILPSLRTMGTPSRAGRADGDALRLEGILPSN